MSNTTNLALPFLAVGQAQKHVTVNESLRKLDALVQLSVVSATTTAEPAGPGDGEVYIVPSGKSGSNWSAYANWSLGYYRDGAWVQVSPREGWLAYVRDSDLLLHYTGSAWSLFAVGKAITVSATDKVLGRSSSGAGAAEEIACTAAGRALIDDADAAAQRTTLGLGTAATHGDGDYVHIAGTESISGAKYFQAKVLVGYSSPTTFGDLPQVGILKTSAGAPSTALALINASEDQHTAVGLDFVPNSNIALARITADRSGTGAQTDFVFSLYSGSGGSATDRWKMLGADGAFRPAADNTQKLGNASFRVSELFCGNGTINTSDAREKADMRALSDAETRAIRRVMAGVGVFQWLGAVALKGADPAQGGARLHCGVSAQAVEAAFAAEGLDARAYGLFCSDEIVERIELAPARIEQAVPAMLDEAGEMIAPAIPEKLVDAVVEFAPKQDEAGRPVQRLGVRYDQIFAMALSALFTPEA